MSMDPQTQPTPPPITVLPPPPGLTRLDYTCAVVPPPAPPPRAQAPRGLGWAVALIACCLVLGIVLAWAGVERQRRIYEQDRAVSLDNGAALAAARLDDIGKLMADPRSQWAPLTALDGLSGSASVVYNASEHSGVLFCPRLPPLPSGQQYQIWAVTDSPHRIAQFTAEAGASVYSFHSDLDLGAAQVFELDAGPDGQPARHLMQGKPR